jgi:hypothetical protein
LKAVRKSLMRWVLYFSPIRGQNVFGGHPQRYL